MLGFFPEAMQLLESKKIHTPQDWLAAINEMIKQREQQYLNEHFSDLKGILLLIDSKNDKMYNLQGQKLIVYQLDSSHDDEER